MNWGEKEKKKKKKKNKKLTKGEHEIFSKDLLVASHFIQLKMKMLLQLQKMLQDDYRSSLYYTKKWFLLIFSYTWGSRDIFTGIGKFLVRVLNGSITLAKKKKRVHKIMQM